MCSTLAVMITQQQGGCTFGRFEQATAASRPTPPPCISHAPCCPPPPPQLCLLCWHELVLCHAACTTHMCGMQAHMPVLCALLQDVAAGAVGRPARFEIELAHSHCPRHGRHWTSIPAHEPGCYIPTPTYTLAFHCSHYIATPIYCRSRRASERARMHMCTVGLISRLCA